MQDGNWWEWYSWEEELYLNHDNLWYVEAEILKNIYSDLGEDYDSFYIGWLETNLDYETSIWLLYPDETDYYGPFENDWKFTEETSHSVI